MLGTPILGTPILDTPILGTRGLVAIVTQEVFVDVALHVYTPEGVKAPSKGTGKKKAAIHRGADERGGGGSSSSGSGPAYIFNRTLPPVRECSVLYTVPGIYY